MDIAFMTNNYITHIYWLRSDDVFNSEAILPKATTQITKFMWPTWGPPGSCRSQVGPTFAPWTLLSGYLPLTMSLPPHLYVLYVSNTSAPTGAAQYNGGYSCFVLWQWLNLHMPKAFISKVDTAYTIVKSSAFEVYFCSGAGGDTYCACMRSSL